MCDKETMPQNKNKISPSAVPSESRIALTAVEKSLTVLFRGTVDASFDLNSSALVLAYTPPPSVVNCLELPGIDLREMLLVREW